MNICIYLGDYFTWKYVLCIFFLIFRMNNNNILKFSDEIFIYSVWNVSFLLPHILLEAADNSFKAIWCLIK